MDEKNTDINKTDTNENKISKINLLHKIIGYVVVFILSGLLIIFAYLEIVQNIITSKYGPRQTPFNKNFIKDQKTNDKINNNTN